MARIHLFELEDQAWFPAVVRNYATDYLQYIQRRLKLHTPIVPLGAVVVVAGLRFAPFRYRSKNASTKLRCGCLANAGPPCPASS